MGFSIALTGLVLFAFGIFMFDVAGKHSKKPLITTWAYIALIGLLAMPVGLIIQIWQ